MTNSFIQEIMAALKRPFSALGTLFGVIIFYILGMTFYVSFVYADIVSSFFGISSSPLFFMQGLALLLSLIMDILALGLLARFVEQSSLREEHSCSLFFRGLRIFFLLAAFVVVYELLLFVSGTLGQIFLALFALSSILFFPGMVLSIVLSDSLRAGFRFGTLVSRIFRSAYLIRFAASIAIFAVYSLITLLVTGWVMSSSLVATASNTLYYGLEGLSFVLYILLFLIAVMTVAPFLAHDLIETEKNKK